MPSASDNPTESMEEDLEQPLLVRMTADENGDLQKLTIDRSPTTLTYDFDPANPDGIFASLNEFVIGIVGGQSDPSSSDIEAELEIDASLKYDFTVKAIEAVSGYKEGDDVVQLIEKINFKDTGEE